MKLGTRKAEPVVNEYLERLWQSLDQVPAEERRHLVEQARARLDLAVEMESGVGEDSETVSRTLSRLGSPDSLAQQLRSEAPPRVGALPIGRLTACRSCRKEVSVEAVACPHCGAPYPARETWRGWGYEWKSKQTLLGLPLVHVAFGRDENGRFRVAKGIVAIGQFGIGAITIAQFGVGALFGFGQLVVAPLSIGQIAIGLVAIGQFGIGLLFGLGQIATGGIAIGQLPFGNWLRGQ